MTEKQIYLLELVKNYDKFCREHEIEYFLAGGSMLGAIRHRGFLPWDDDVDVYIKSSEWETAMGKFEEHLPERYQMDCIENNPGCNNTIIRLVDTETCEYHSSRLADDTSHGLYIEMFRLDPVPDDSAFIDKYYNDFWVYCEGLSQYHNVAKPTLDLSKLRLRDYLSFQKKLNKGDREALLKQKEKELFRYDEEECSVYHERWGLYWLMYPKEVFSKQLYVPFEDTELPVAGGFADVLFGEYGDNWMDIPDEENQATHPGVENNHVPYRFYDEDINRRLNREKYLHMVLDKKIKRVKNVFYTYNIRLERLKILEKLLRRELEEAGAAGVCRQALADRDYQKIMAVLSKYIAEQKDAYGDNFCFGVDPDIIYAAAYARLMIGDHKYVERLRINLKGKRDGRLTELFSDLKEIRKIRFSLFYGTLDENSGELDRMLAKYPDQVDLRELRLTLDLKNKKESNEKIIQTAEKLAADHPGRPRVMKLYADALSLRDGLRRDLYEAILESSRDGMVNQEVRDVLCK